jgi:hypothetical protein
MYAHVCVCVEHARTRTQRYFINSAVMQAEPALSYTCSEPRCYMYVCIYIYIYILICIYIYIYYILSGPNTRAEVLHKIGAVAQTEPELRASHLI